MNDESFARLVAEEVKNKASSHQRSFLRQSDNRQRWITELKKLLVNLDGQIQDLDRQEKTEINRFLTLGIEAEQLIQEYKTGVDQRRRKIARFRFHVESRLDEVERWVVVESTTPEERGRAQDFFRSAILKHKELMAEFEFEFSEIDEALWATLEGKWLFDVHAEAIREDDESSVAG